MSCLKSIHVAMPVTSRVQERRRVAGVVSCRVVEGARSVAADSAAG